jgi:PadR family transcriptional regulator PadR
MFAEVKHMTEGEKNTNDVENSKTQADIPLDFLSPWILLTLNNMSMHGYQLMQVMTISGLAAFDPATVYRTLRRLEKEGVIVSDWQIGDTGPAKRVYSLTSAGEKMLKDNILILKQYQNILDRFFELFVETKSNKEKN